MAAQTEKDALTQLKAILVTATVTGQPALTGGYILPDEYTSIPQTLSLPCLVVSKVYNVPNSWRRKAAGLGLHEWRAEVLLYAAPGPLKTLTGDAAAAMLKTRGWAQAFAEKMWANQSLNGTALIIGEPDGDMRRLFQYAEGHVYLGSTATYWGCRLELAIQQTHAQNMASM